MKTIVCSICNQEVSKRNTLSVGDGKRACRTHDGVESQAEKAQSVIDAKEAKGREHKRWRTEPPKRPVADGPIPAHCWVCGTEGYHAQHFYMQKLLLEKEYNLTYNRTLNPFDAVECAKAYAKMVGKCCLFTKPYDETMKIWFKDYNAFSVARLIKGMLICAECCHQKKIEINPGLKEVPLEDVLLIGMLIQEQLDPLLIAAAKESLAERN